MLNEIGFALLEKDFPGISAAAVGAWIDSDVKLTLLCVVHHRSAAGVHIASFSDFDSEYYVRDLISKPEVFVALAGETHGVSCLLT